MERIMSMRVEQKTFLRKTHEDQESMRKQGWPIKDNSSNVT